MAIYGREALRLYRERQEQGARAPEQPSLLDKISPDAPMDDATIGVWNGERFVSYNTWLATAPLIIEERQDKPCKDTGTHEEKRSKAPRRDEAELW